MSGLFLTHGQDPEGTLRLTLCLNSHSHFLFLLAKFLYLRRKTQETNC